MAQRFYSPAWRHSLRFASWQRTISASCLFAALLAPQCAEATNVRKYILYVGSYTVRGSRGIYAYSFDASTGRLTPMGLETEVINPSFLTVEPSRRFLYSVSEIDNYKGQRSGALFAYRIDTKTGQLTPLNQVASRGSGPCFLSLDRTGKFLFTANYGSGSIAVFPLLADGKLGEASASVQHTGSSVNPVRQAGPHAHFIEAAFDNRFAIVADVGVDQLLVYKFDPTKGSLTPSTPAYTKVRSGAGPRHFVFHPHQPYLYLASEIDSSVSVFSYDSQLGTLQEKQSISALPKGYSGQTDAAEIQIDASGKFLYVSNRGADDITLFRISPESGMLNAIESVPSGGKTPRYFAIDPTGEFLLVGNENSDNIVSFRIDHESGKLTNVAEIKDVISPVCFAFLQTE